MRFFKWLNARLCDFRYWLCKGSQQSHPPLFQLRSFWAMVLIPLSLAIVITFFIAQSLSFPDMELTKDGFDNAYDYFKIPLWIAALSLPLAGFYASHHHSVQTAAQIERSDRQIKATDDKNSFENYIKHWQMFNERLDEIGMHHSIIFNDRRTIYDCFFSGNNWKNFRPFSYLDSEGFKSEQEERAREFYFSQKELLQDCNKIIKKPRFLNERNLADEHSTACNTLRRFLDNFGIELNKDKYSNYDISHTKPIFKELNTTLKVFHMLCVFAFENSISGIEEIISQLPSEGMETFSRKQLEIKINS